MNQTADHTCPVCSLTFSRKSHLQRHHDTHTTRKAWKCDFCASQFKRSDALRKHWKTCSLRKLLGEAMPAQPPPGPKRRACDRCANNKQRCDRNIPCSNCAAKSYACSYERASGILTSCNSTANFFNVETWNFALSPTGLGNFSAELWNNNNGQRLLTDHDRRNDHLYEKHQPSHVQIGFIVQLTKCSGLYQVFNYSSPDESASSPDQGNLLDSLIDWANPPWFDEDAGSCNAPNNSSVIETSQMASWISHPLFPQSTAIWSTIQGSPLFNPSASSALDPQCTPSHPHIEFFNPFNLERYLQLFWSRWSPHCPIIHQPSFDLGTTPTYMVLVMALIGYFMSNNPEDASNPRNWLDIAEWLVFEQLNLWSTFRRSLGEGSETLLRDDLRLLQSAQLVCTVQHWDGSKESKERARDQQFPLVVAAARDIGFDRANHCTDIDLDHGFIDWSQWILNEELIRTYTYIFLFDYQYAIFHGVTPRIKLPELNMMLASPEPCFKASNVDELLMALQGVGHSPVANNTIRDLVQELCSENDHSTELQDMAGMSVLSLVTLIVAIQAAILCQSMSLCISPSIISALRGSLEKWKVAWDTRLKVSDSLVGSDTSLSSDSFLEEDGWLRHAPEYYRVATLMLDKMSSNIEKTKSGRMAPCRSSTSQLEEVLELIT